MTPSTFIPPCVLHEDEHLLVVNKPAGWNTHSPSLYAGEGIYEWLKHREPRWAKLAIIHRLDKETSGLMAFGKTSLANRSLTEQFAGRAVRKTYVLHSERQPKRSEFTIKSRIVRAGDRYVSGGHGEEAETRFKIRKPKSEIQDANGATLSGWELVAEPLTGRTHQIRVHAAANGFPILGDALYGGKPFARLCLHAEELVLMHPATGEPMTFRAPAEFSLDTAAVLRTAIIEPQFTDAFRLIHGASDRWPGWYVEQFGGYLLSQSESSLASPQAAFLKGGKRSVYHKVLSKHVRSSTVAQSSPQLVVGQPAPERFVVQENGVKFEISFNEGYSVGLFLDQRENRRCLLTRHLCADFSLGAGLQVLNTFAYTCGFSVCAAMAGAHTTSLDLSKKYLEWGKRNFTLNGLDPAQHDFIYGDTFDWLKRFARKGRSFDVVILDPPTFSQSKEHGVFRAEKEYGELVKAALPVLNSNGVLFASTNAAELPPERFISQINEAIGSARRKIVQQHYAPQPPDFPISRAEPAYLKTVWLRVL